MICLILSSCLLNSFSYFFFYLVLNPQVTSFYLWSRYWQFFFHFMLGSSSWTPSVTKFKAWFTVLNPLENKVVLIKRSMEFFFIFIENVILFYCYYYFVLYIQNILPPPEFIIVVDCVVIRATFVLGGPLYKLLFLNVKTPGS